MQNLFRWNICNNFLNSDRKEKIMQDAFQSLFNFVHLLFISLIKIQSLLLTGLNWLKLGGFAFYVLSQWKQLLTWWTKGKIFVLRLNFLQNFYFLQSNKNISCIFFILKYFLLHNCCGLYFFLLLFIFFFLSQNKLAINGAEKRKMH